MNRKWGFHSGTMKCQDAKIQGDCYVQDDIVFSDVSAGTLGITGGIDMQSTTNAIGIDLGGTFSTAAINIDGSGVTGRAIRIGTKDTGLKISSGLALDAEPANNYLFGLFSVVSATEATSTDELRSAWIRTRVNVNMDIGSNAGWGYGVCGAEVQLKFYGGTTQVYAWQNSALWAQIESQAATTTFKSGSYTQAVLANIGLTSATLESGAVIAGVTINANTSTLTNTGDAYYGLFITDKNTTSTDFSSAIYIASSVAATGISILGCTTGIAFTVAAAETVLNIDAGTTDHTGANIITADLDVNSASCKFINADIDVSTALSISEYVYGVYIDIAGAAGDNAGAGLTAFYGKGDVTSGAPVVGMELATAFDTGIIISAATTTGISISGASTTAVSIAADATTGISITNAMSATNVISIAATASTAGINISGNCTTAINIAAQTTSGITFAGGASYNPIHIGVKDNVADSGLILTGATDDTGGVMVFCDDGGDALASVTSPIWTRYLITKVSQTSGCTATGLYTQLKTLTGMTITTGSYTALKAFLQVGGTLTTDNTGSEVSIMNAGVSFEGNYTCTLGTFSGIDININDGTNTIGTHTGLIIRKTSSSTAGWTTGISIPTGGAVTGISIGNCTTGISISGTGAAATSKALTTTGWTINNANLTDGYGIVEADLTLTGTVAGHCSALSAWVNMSSVTTGGNYICAQTNGLWSASGGVLTNGVFIFGMRAQCLLQTNGGVSGAKFYPFSVVNNTNITTAIFKCNAGSSDLGTTAVSKTTEGKYVPLYEDDAGVHYVLIYN